jgi:predicted ATP-grasp superfamily ATP-dependent carboligase
MATKILNGPTLTAPVLIAGWPGMGQVGVGAADYMRRRLNAEPYAQIDVTSYVIPDAIAVEAGMGRLPDPPKEDIYYVAEPRLFIFVGDTQLAGEAGLKLAGELLDFAQSHGVGTIYTGAAFAMAVSFRSRPEVFGVANEKTLKAGFPLLGVEPLKEGRISGLNGLLLGLAAKRDIAAACFLATMPQYAIETPNPKASRALVEVFQRVLNTTVDLTEIDSAVRETDKLLRDFEEKVTAAVQQLKESMTPGPDRKSGEETESEEQPEPHELMAKVETMFDAAQHDRAKALLLKQELDRLGLFHLYEDRFLDLFNSSRPPHGGTPRV